MRHIDAINIGPVSEASRMLFCLSVGILIAQSLTRQDRSISRITGIFRPCQEHDHNRGLLPAVRLLAKMPRSQKHVLNFAV